MIATLDDLKVLMGIPERDDSEDELLSLYLDPVDSLFNLLCDREFDSIRYTHEEYYGIGGKRLWLRNIPVTSIVQLSTSRLPAIKIKNTSSDAASATVTVDVSAKTIALTVAGGANASTSTTDLTGAPNDTLSELVAVIDALGNGWDAEIYDTDLNSVPSIELLEVMALNCGVPRGGGAASWKELDIPGTPLGGEFRIENANMGTILFTASVDYAIVSYVAGYSTMPNDLAMGVLAGAQALYMRGEEDGFGAKNFSDGTLRVSYGDWLPDISLKMIEKYKRKTLG